MTTFWRKSCQNDKCFPKSAQNAGLNGNAMFTQKLTKRDSDSPVGQISSKNFVSNVQMSKKGIIRRVMAISLQNYNLYIK